MQFYFSKTIYQRSKIDPEIIAALYIIQSHKDGLKRAKTQRWVMEDRLGYFIFSFKGVSVNMFYTKNRDLVISKKKFNTYVENDLTTLNKYINYVKFRYLGFETKFEQYQTQLNLALSVRESRLKLGWRALDLAQISKVPKSNISRIESGANVSLNTITKVANAMNLNIKLLFERK